MAERASEYQMKPDHAWSPPSGIPRQLEIVVTGPVPQDYIQNYAGQWIHKPLPTNPHVFIQEGTSEFLYWSNNNDHWRIGGGTFAHADPSSDDFGCGMWYLTVPGGPDKRYDPGLEIDGCTLNWLTKDQDFALQRAIAIGKGAAGTIRFIFEDVLSGAFQSIFLIKKWHELGAFQIAYTTASISAGIACSLAGPLLEFCNMPSAPGLQLDAYDHDSVQVAEEVAKELTSDKTSDSKPLLRSSSFHVPDIRMSTFLIRAVQAKSPELREAGVAAHRALVGTSLIFWIAMACLPWMFDYQCGEGLPQGALLVFFTISTLHTLVELWVLIHGRRGYELFLGAGRKFGLALLFGKLGHFDTFSDVTNARMAAVCEPITWFSIKGHIFRIPDLSMMMTVVIIVGIFFLQAIPGLYLLSVKKWLPIAFKFNEYCFLLSAVEDEMKHT